MVCRSQCSSTGSGFLLKNLEIHDILKENKKQVITISQNVYFFFDDSGVLHKNESSGFFVYAGYVFTGRKDVDNAKRKYIAANKKIKQATRIDSELKAAVLSNQYKRSLFNSIRNYDSVSVAVEICRVYDYILDDKKSRCRYKDYILKRCVKRKLLHLINNGVLNSHDDINLWINIDEQLTATNGYYDLRDSIREELQHGIKNFDYGFTHEKVFHGKVTVDIKYCESKTNYLIQASDIIANRIWTSYRLDKPELRDISNHLALTFP